ncbi:hypothetical protein C8R45DRAFT_1224880, partial [Mycena sanguinolenta]
MSTQRPSRIHRATVPVDGALIPVSQRNQHSFFRTHRPDLIVMEQQSRSTLPFAAADVLGECKVLSMPDTTKERFDMALASLKDVTGARYIATNPPAAVISRQVEVFTVEDDEAPEITSDNDRDLGATLPPAPSRDLEGTLPPAPKEWPKPTLHSSIVSVNFKNNDTGTTFTFALKLDLPGVPFASQIIASIWNHRRVQVVVSGWETTHIWVAYSRKLIPVSQPDHDGLQTGFQELGMFHQVFGNYQEMGFGGPVDEVVRTVLVDASELNDFRQLYGVPSTANVFSMYFFYLDRAGHSAAAVAASAESVPHAPPSMQSTTAPTPSPSVGELLRARFPKQIAHMHAIEFSQLGQAYKTHSFVRLVRDMAESMGMTWPDAGVPKPAHLDDQIKISVDDILKLSSQNRPAGKSASPQQT